MRKRMTLILSLLALTVAAIAVVSRSTGTARADAPKTPWKITGQL